MDGQNVTEDLPTYEPGSQNNEAPSDESSNDLDQSTLFVEHLDQVVDSFVESILSQVTESSYHSDDTDVEVDDADYSTIERLEE